jgi:two-component system phosphate regulon response regulator OmpR
VAGSGEPDVQETGHILIVDDDARLRGMLVRYLMGEGFRITEAADGAGMRAAMIEHRIDLVLLDLVLQNEDGLTLARELRSTSTVGIIMLTGRSDIIDRVAGLEVGADDYVAKPFHLREILARVRSVLRRTRGLATAPAAASPPGSPPGVYRFEGWELGVHQRRLVAPDGSEIPLTTGEFDLLLAFVTHPGRVLTRDQLMDLTRARVWAAFDRSIDQRVARLRKRIEPDANEPRFIKSVRGAGYLFAATVRSG